MTRALARDLMPIGATALLFDNELTYQKRREGCNRFRDVKGSQSKVKGKHEKIGFLDFYP